MSEKNITIAFSEQINSDSVYMFINKLEQINNKNPQADKLTINISSLGGNVDIAIELFNFINTLDCHIKMVNTSYVNSAAIIVFLAGDERICLPGSSFYVHSITKHLDGNYCADELIREAREMNANTEKVTSLLELKTNKNKTYWKKLMKKGQMISKGKAFELGITTA
ncbi:MAG: ATP-dependent Clp protease proteolytic subunit [Prevotella sp.]|nr:ATP-dependent Clp protease proteolytic subunit [Prevotella sp.]